MGILADLLQKITLRRRREELSPARIEELRTAFKDRYHSFKVLLAANNKALEIMAEMEEALRGARPFGMSFIRADCTAVSVNVFRIVKNLDQLAPGKYEELFDRFKKIQGRINEVLSRRRLPKGERLVLPFEAIDVTMADQVGSKMANLGEVMTRLDLAVPPGFVITSLAYQRFFEHNELQTEIDRILQASEVDQLDQLFSLSADIQQLIIRATVPPDLEEVIKGAYRQLEAKAGAGVKVSMRSSALGEDLAGTSFAGQYRSQLNVSPEDLIEAYKEIVASKYSLQAIAYRLNRGILDEDVAMCVGCMVMINASSGGVTYSRNPLHLRDDSITINSVWGLPKSVVDGSVAADLFVVSRDPSLPIMRREIQTKEQKFACYPDEGVCRLEVTGSKSKDSSLSDEQVRRLAEIALRLEDYYGSPQDIEWAIDDHGSVFLLQCRPLKQPEGGDGGAREVLPDLPR